MAASVEILTAIRELTNSKQIDRAELHGLLEDGINAALAKKHGPTVQAEVDIDENKGAIRIVLLKTVVEEVTDPASQISLEEARFEDPTTGRTDEIMEGLYLRTEAGGVVTGRAKVVRPEFVEKVKRSAHWQYQAMTPNRLEEGADLWS